MRRGEKTWLHVSTVRLGFIQVVLVGLHIIFNVTCVINLTITVLLEITFTRCMIWCLALIGYYFTTRHLLDNYSLVHHDP